MAKRCPQPERELGMWEGGGMLYPEEGSGFEKGVLTPKVGGAVSVWGGLYQLWGAALSEGVPTMVKKGPALKRTLGGKEGLAEEGWHGGGVLSPSEPGEGQQARGEHVQWKCRHPEGQGGEQARAACGGNKVPTLRRRGRTPGRTHRGCRRNRPSCGESAGLRAQRGGHFIQRTD